MNNINLIYRLLTNPPSKIINGGDNDIYIKEINELKKSYPKDPKDSNDLSTLLTILEKDNKILTLKSINEEKKYKIEELYESNPYDTDRSYQSVHIINGVIKDNESQIDILTSEIFELFKEIDIRDLKTKLKNQLLINKIDSLYISYKEQEKQSKEQKQSNEKKQSNEQKQSKEDKLRILKKNLEILQNKIENYKKTYNINDCQKKIKEFESFEKINLDKINTTKKQIHQLDSMIPSFVGKYIRRLDTNIINQLKEGGGKLQNIKLKLLIEHILLHIK